MLRRVAYPAVVVAMGLLLAGCALGIFGFERRAEWHDAEERSCMQQHAVVFTAWERPASRVNDSGACGILKPIAVAAMESGTLALTPTATINCPMTSYLEEWVTDAVQPAALVWFGQPLSGLKQIAAYSCRPIDSIPGKSLSEHAYGNAIDIAAFVLADGEAITVKHDWTLGDDRARGFLREVFAAACQRFKTVLGPGEPYHGDHFHLDLAHHGRDRTSRYCNPKPVGPAPVRAPYSGAVASNGSGGGLFDWMHTGSIAPAAPLPAPGPLLDQRPDDVIADEIEDAGAD